MANVRRIFKSEIMGKPTAEIVLNNQIHGIFGKKYVIIDMQGVDLVQENFTNGTYGASANFRFNTVNPNLSHTRDATFEETKIGGTTDYTVTYNFKYPVRNLNIDVRMVIKKRDYSNSTTTGIIWNNSLADLHNSIINSIHDFMTASGVTPTIEGSAYYYEVNPSIKPTSTSGVFTPWGKQHIYWHNGIEWVRPDLSSLPTQGEIRVKIPFTIVKQTSTSITLRHGAGFNDNENPELWRNRYYTYKSTDSYGVFLGGGIEISERTPFYVERLIYGDTINTDEQAVLIGEEANALEIPSNPLVTERSTISIDSISTPLYQYRANRIINDWHDGKQTLRLTKVIDNNDDIVEMGTTAVILDTRESDFIDENTQSLLKNEDGSAKKFIVTSAEFIYDGSCKQLLDFQEIKENNA